MSETTEIVDLYVPDQMPIMQALSRTTHLAIGAHQDDLEIIGFHGIAQCYQQRDQWFTGIVMTDGAGSPRSGDYAQFTNEQMAAVRKQEQRKAAEIGEYSAVIQYGLGSSHLKGSINWGVVDQLKQWLDAAEPEVVYLHNLADRHETHVSVSVHALEALRALSKDKLPRKIYGVEGWRDLDWLPASYRLELDVSQQRDLFIQLIRVFDSQISGGKRYDLAAEARQLVNATFGYSHSVDTSEYVTLAMDLMPLLDYPHLSYSEFIQSLLLDFTADIQSGLKPYSISEVV